jgi:C4-dicarboxylate-specific signal transduction histidine kinase
MLKPLIALYFFILGAIQLGLWMGLYRTYRAKNLVKPSHYWMLSLGANILALFIFGYGVLFVEDVKRPQFNFTIANTLFYIAALSQYLFCKSLNQPISDRFDLLAKISVIAFFIVFELLRQFTNFEIRTSLVVILILFMFSFQILELQRFKKKEPSHQLTYMQIATAVELFFALGRMTILIAGAVSIQKVDQLPQLLIFVTIAQLVANTVAYIAIGSYWTEKIAISRAMAVTENQVIKSLLSEREELISSLLIANKTAATGALSASIAHELNQPVAAISLNTEFIQRKLNEGQADQDGLKEVITHIQEDNQRIARIVSTLRDIFRQEEIKASDIHLDELIEQIKPIILPQVRDFKIDLKFDLNVNQSIPLNSNEISQVIINLLNNSIEALSNTNQSSKLIEIHTRVFGNYVELKISDNGPGIPDQLKVSIFDLMKTNKKQGMGLGLWLCKHIVDRHQGRISYQQSALGGAEFLIQLPIECVNA